MERERISRAKYLMKIAAITSERSTCPKKSVGAALALDGRIIATGYNGVLPKANHSEGIDKDGITHTVHAEANIIAFCAKNGIATDKAILFTTLSPCEKCAELIIQAGIDGVVYLEEYRDRSGLDDLIENGIFVQQIDEIEE